MKKWINEQQTILEKEMIEAKVKEMQQEIDREVLWGMLKELGWVRVNLSNETAMVYATRISEWLIQNCQGSYERHRSDFIFEDSRDATMFILKWV
jgi:hypothetical protein